MRPLRLLLAVVVLVAAAPVEVGAQPAAPPLGLGEPSADVIVGRMLLAYGACRSYRDVGGVRRSFVRDGAVAWATCKSFHTLFLRPLRLRFEFSERMRDGVVRRYVVWSDGRSARTYGDLIGEVEERESPWMAIAAATGVSDCAANTIPLLLMPDPDPGSWSFVRFRPTERLGDEFLDGCRCFHVKGLGAGATPQDLWIDRETYLLRRIDETGRVESYQVTTSTTYAPLVNEPVSEHELLFRAP